MHVYLKYRRPVSQLLNTSLYNYEIHSSKQEIHSKINTKVRCRQTVEQQAAEIFSTHACATLVNPSYYSKILSVNINV
jgi:hypothetical protein